LSEIIEKRAGIARSQSVKLVDVLREWQMIRRESATFKGKYSFLTLRDLFRWAFRCSNFRPPTQFYDWKQHFAEEGYLVLTSRSRSSDGSEETIVSSVLKKVFKLQDQITMESIMRGALLGDESKLIEENQTLKDGFKHKV
jgi:midasin